MTSSDFSDYRGKTVLVTGGAGMLGSTVTNILANYDARVTVVDALLPLYGGNMFNLSPSLNKIRFVQGDIRDASLMELLVAGQEFIFNLAAQVSYLDSNIDPFLDLDINCRGSLTLLEACRKTNTAAKVLFSSSRFVYGTINYNPVDEFHPYNCVSMYGIHKLAGEKYHHFYTKVCGIDTCSVRIANPYGPRQQMKHSKYGILNWFIRQALDGKPLTIYGSGSQKRDYIYVEDLANAMLTLALVPNTRGETYNLGSGKGASFREMAETIASAIPGTVIQDVPWPAGGALVETGDYITDLSKLMAKCDWKPKTSLGTGIEKTIAYYRAHRGHYWKAGE